MGHVDRKAGDGEADGLGQVSESGALVHVASYGDHGGDVGQLVEDRRVPNVAGMENEVDSRVELRHPRVQEPVGVGDDAGPEAGGQGSMAHRKPMRGPLSRGFPNIRMAMRIWCEGDL